MDFIFDIINKYSEFDVTTLYYLCKRYEIKKKHINVYEYLTPKFIYFNKLTVRHLYIPRNINNFIKCRKFNKVEAIKVHEWKNIYNSLFPNLKEIKFDLDAIDYDDDIYSISKINKLKYLNKINIKYNNAGQNLIYEKFVFDIKRLSKKNISIDFLIISQRYSIHGDTKNSEIQLEMIKSNNLTFVNKENNFTIINLDQLGNFNTFRLCTYEKNNVYIKDKNKNLKNVFITYHRDKLYDCEFKTEDSVETITFYLDESILITTITVNNKQYILNKKKNTVYLKL